MSVSPDPSRIAYFPLDIGKNVHWFAAYSGPALNPLAAPEAVRANQAGFERAAGVLSGLLVSGQFDEVVLGNEPTGIYHEAWARAFQQRFALSLKENAGPQLRYRFVNPYQVKQARQRLLGRNRKTDALDLPAIARCLADGGGHPAYLPSAADLRFQQWADRFHQAAVRVKVQTRRVLRDLDQLWPGAAVNVARFRQVHPDLEPPAPLALSRPLERDVVQTLLAHCPDPHHVRAMSESDLIAFLRRHTGRGGPATAQRVLACAREALLPPPEITAILAERLQADFAVYQTAHTCLEQLRAESGTLVSGSPAEVLTTAGLSAFLAARYLAGVGHHRRFQSAAEVWAFAGFDPLPGDSGDSRHPGHISRRGDPVFRDTLFLIGLALCKHCPQIAGAKLRAEQRGLGHAGAVLHAAHKANRLCWHLLYHQEQYDPQYC